MLASARRRPRPVHPVRTGRADRRHRPSPGPAHLTRSPCRTESAPRRHRLAPTDGAPALRRTPRARAAGPWRFTTPCGAACSNLCCCASPTPPASPLPTRRPTGGAVTRTDSSWTPWSCTSANCTRRRTTPSCWAVRSALEVQAAGQGAVGGLEHLRQRADHLPRQAGLERDDLTSRDRHVLGVRAVVGTAHAAHHGRDLPTRAQPAVRIGLIDDADALDAGDAWVGDLRVRLALAGGDFGLVDAEGPRLDAHPAGIARGTGTSLISRASRPPGRVLRRSGAVDALVPIEDGLEGKVADAFRGGAVDDGGATAGSARRWRKRARCRGYECHAGPVRRCGPAVPGRPGAYISVSCTAGAPSDGQIRRRWAFPPAAA